MNTIKAKDTGNFVHIYRYLPLSNRTSEFLKLSNYFPHLVTYRYDSRHIGPMVLDLLIFIKNTIDSSLSFRRSCREGICGSCSMNIDGINGLACLREREHGISVYPLPHMSVLKDLISDLSVFYEQYAYARPWVEKNAHTATSFQTKHQRRALDGLYDCILCACCSTSCPSYWWNSSNNGYGYLGPASLLQSYRWIVDSRDRDLSTRVERVDDVYKLYRCHTILNCSAACPKGLNPGGVVTKLKDIIEF